MKVSTRFLAIATAVLVMVVAASAARAQILGPGGTFPQCDAGGITINNHSKSLVVICLKWVGCYKIPPGPGTFVPLPVGSQIPGVAGVANITYEWAPNPAPPNYWVPSVALNPTGDCYNVLFDQSTCTIDIFPASGPPCLNP